MKYLNDVSQYTQKLQTLAYIENTQLEINKKGQYLQSSLKLNSIYPLRKSQVTKCF